MLSTLLVYALYVFDSRSRSNGIVNLDEYVFWIRSVCHVIEFICGLVMFFNGAYILLFESSNWLRAIMMTMHAYVNIYRYVLWLSLGWFKAKTCLYNWYMQLPRQVFGHSA